jgi:hypothetical protein
MRAAPLFAPPPVLPAQHRLLRWDAGPGKLYSSGNLGERRASTRAGQRPFGTPDGSRFGSTVSNNIHPAAPTFAGGREAWFTWLPASEVPLARPSFVARRICGRPPGGENCNIGLTTVTGAPYPEIYAAARAFHSALYARRLAR